MGERHGTGAEPGMQSGGVPPTVASPGFPTVVAIFGFGFFLKLIYLKSHHSCAKKTPEGKKKRESPTAFFTRSQMNTDIST